jgi:hypothetical protein
MNYKLGQIVYHKDVYNYKEPLKVIGIKENKLELEGDYSGGTHNVKQSDWLNIEGTSKIYNYGYKKECRDFALATEILAYPITDRNQDNMTKTMFDLLDMVLVLTNDV